MKQASELRAGRHVVFRLHAHLVFVPKYRRGALTDRIRAFLRPVLETVCANFGAELVAFDGEDDHVHLLVEYPPKVALASLVNSLKGASSRRVRKEAFPEVQLRLWGGAFWAMSRSMLIMVGDAT